MPLSRAAGLVLALVLTACGGGNGPDPIPDPVTTTPDVVRAYAVTDDSLYNVTLNGTAADQLVMPLSYTSSITDAAQVGTTLYAATFSTLLKIDLSTKTISAVGPFGPGTINALTVNAAGALYAAGVDGSVYTVDTRTDAATKVMAMPFASSGDLAFAPDGTLYATVLAGGSSDTLVRVDLTAKGVTVLGITGQSAVYGLDYLYGTLYGRTNSGRLLTLDTTTGAATVIRTTGLTFTSVH